ncbi:MAG TPA: hypothetical protein VF115_00665 [Acidimicrobiia bacterium]
MSTKFDERQLDRDAEGSDSIPPDRAATRSFWNWFGAVFGIVVLVGAVALYVTGRDDPVAEQPTVTEPEAAPPVAEEPAEEPLELEDEPSVTTSGQSSSVLLGIYVVDSFGFHGMEETYAEATEVGERDAGQVAKVLAATDAVDWPTELTEAATVFRGDVAGLHEALEAGDLEGVRSGLEAVHGSQHDLSNGVYAWLAGTPVAEPTADSGDQVAEVIEIDMFDFGYTPEAIDLQAEVPVILRFTNSGKLEHEAMVGDGHMQEEWAAAGQEGGHDPRDGHHGDLMAVTVLPGETQDLEVMIDEAGTWYMACHITGHYEQGQIATINVNA